MSDQDSAFLADLRRLDETLPAVPWRVAPAYGALVSPGMTGHDDPDSVKAYGGHLVAESMPRERSQALADLRNMIPTLIERLAYLEQREAEVEQLGVDLALSLADAHRFAKMVAGSRHIRRDARDLTSGGIVPTVSSRADESIPF